MEFGKWYRMIAKDLFFDMMSKKPKISYLLPQNWWQKLYFSVLSIQYTYNVAAEGSWLLDRPVSPFHFLLQWQVHLVDMLSVHTGKLYVVRAGRNPKI